MITLNAAVKKEKCPSFCPYLRKVQRIMSSMFTYYCTCNNSLKMLDYTPSNKFAYRKVECVGMTIIGSDK